MKAIYMILLPMFKNIRLNKVILRVINFNNNITHFTEI